MDIGLDSDFGFVLPPHAGIDIADFYFLYDIQYLVYNDILVIVCF